MAALQTLLGETLLGKNGEVRTADAVGGKEAVALYFSAHWCPPCRGFTPQFASWYSEGLKEKGLEVIFVSSDRDESSFQEYFGEMPWLALGFSDRERKEELSKKFKVQGIPSVVILDGEGKTITKDGRSAIAGDPTGNDFPWKPKSLSEIWDGAKIIGQNGAEHTAECLKEKVYALYFSAHWCPPCRGFTPQLAQWYTQDLKEKGLEIVFVSSDRDESSFNEYFSEMPWLALEYSDRKRKEQLSTLFGVRGIPSVVIIDQDGSTISKDGRASLSADPTGAEFPWYPKPVKNLAGGPGDINEVPTVVAFCEASAAETQKAAEAAMSPIASRYLAEAKAAGEESPALAFMIATASSGLTAKIRSMLSMQSVPEEAGAEVSLAPQLMLIDIPDDGGYYAGPEGAIDEDVVAKFVADYTAKPRILERKQLEG